MSLLQATIRITSHCVVMEWVRLESAKSAGERLSYSIQRIIETLEAGDNINAAASACLLTIHADI